MTEESVYIIRHILHKSSPSHTWQLHMGKNCFQKEIQMDESRNNIE